MSENKKIILIISGAILLAAVLITAILRDRLVNPQFRSVTIMGQGKVSYNPDLALLTLGVQIDKVAKPEEALEQLNSKVNNIIKAVKALGIKDENIQTQNYSLYPQYDYKDNVQTVSGYSANQQLVIKITDYDREPNKLSQIIAAASKAGANQVNNLSFDASNFNDLKQTARIKAIEDAQAKSLDLAKTAQVKLKDVIGWYENFINPISSYDYGKGGMGGGAPVASAQIPSGSREIIVEIGLSYNIK